MSNETPKMEFAFQRRNYLLLLGGVTIVVLGFMLMSGGGSDDPDVFAGTYMLNDTSFDEMAEGQFQVTDGVLAQLEPLRNKEFAGENELMEEVKALIGDVSFDENFFEIRSATDIQPEIFSARRISIAPVVVLLGYGFILYAIMSRVKPAELRTKEV